MGEWNGYSSPSALQAIFLRRANFAKAAIWSEGPEMVTERGELSAATAIWSKPPSSIAARVASSPASTAAMVPRSRIFSWLRERTWIRRTASGRSKAPAAQAAATSPTEWPSTASGFRPFSARLSTVATWVAKISGWAREV